MKNLLLIFSFAFILFSCKKDDDFSTNNQNQQQQITDEEFAQENFGDAITTNFIGRIVNQEGRQLKDVTITIGNSSTTTDHNGVFVLNNASVYDKFAFVKAEKEGYIKGSRVVVPTPNGTNDIQITLLEKNIIDTVTSGETSNVTLSNGSNVEFQGEFIDSSGNSYSGQVEVSMHYLQPNNEDTFTEMPGNLFGMREDGSAAGMETYGMLAINLFSPSGEQLNIDSEFPSTLTFPVDASTPNAPTEIPLWYFDEEQGFWKEEGNATRIGNDYIAEVTHFSWWNCDLPLEYINVCFTLTHDIPNENRTIDLPNFKIEIIRNETNQTIYSGYTNDLGQECGFFPKDEMVTINVYSDCGNLNYSEQLGPFSSDASFEINVPILPSELKETKLIASITTCTGSPVTNGYLFIFDRENNFDILNITSQNIEIPFTYCDSSDYDFIIYDLDSNQSSGVLYILLQETETNIGNVFVCGNQVGGTFDGDIFLNFQYEVDNFKLLGYDIIDGNMRLGGYFWVESDINSLDGLSNINAINGDLFIDSNEYFSSSLEGLENLTYIGGDLKLQFNFSLTNLIGLNNLETINGDLYIFNNYALVSFDGLEKLNNIGGDLYISESVSLNSLVGLENLTNIGNNLILGKNHSLISLNGLEKITSLNVLSINESDLTSLNGLENLININSISIGIYWDSGNPITDYCALDNLFRNGTYGDVHIANNAYNPTVQDIIDGNCSL